MKHINDIVHIYISYEIISKIWAALYSDLRLQICEVHPALAAQTMLVRRINSD